MQERLMELLGAPVKIEKDGEKRENSHPIFSPKIGE